MANPVASSTVQDMRFVMAKRVEMRPLVATSSLPVFTPAAAAALEQTQAAASEDGRKWIGLRGWLDGPGMKLLCRRAEFRITIPAKASVDAQLLPPAQEPAATLSWMTRNGDKRSVPMAVMLDLSRRVLTLALGTTADQYDEIVYALNTTQVLDDCVAALDCRHAYTVRIPPPPTPTNTGIIWRPEHLKPVVDTGASLGTKRVAFAAPAGGMTSVVGFNPTLLTNSRTIRAEVAYKLPPAEPTLNGAVLDQSQSFQLSARKEDLTVFPDLPRQVASGWGEVPGRELKTPLHFRDSGDSDKFFYLPSSFKLGFGRDGDAARPPMRAEIYLDDQGRHRVKVTLVALPFMDDQDREALRAYLRSSVLQNTVEFVGLTLAGGLESQFLPDFSTSDGSAGLPANIAFTAIEVAPDKWLRMAFDMEAGSYPVFCELIRKGMRGRVTFKAPGIQHGVPVILELASIVTDAVRASVDTSTLAVSLDNLVAYPITLSSVRAALLDIGPSTGMIFASEELELSTATTRRIEPKTPWAGTIVPKKVQGFDEIVMSMGPVVVDGGEPQDWLDRVNRDPSLTPQPLRVKLSLSVLAFALPRVELVQVRLMREGQAAPRQEHRLLPGAAPLELSVDLTLAELAAGSSSGLYLEYETLQKDGRLSPVQRQAIRATQREMVAIALVDGADLTYTLDAQTPAGAMREDVDQAQLAERIRGLALQRAARWQVYARQTPAS